MLFIANLFIWNSQITQTHTLQLFMSRYVGFVVYFMVLTTLFAIITGSIFTNQMASAYYITYDALWLAYISIVGFIKSMHSLQSLRDVRTESMARNLYFSIPIPSAISIIHVQSLVYFNPSFISIPRLFQSFIRSGITRHSSHESIMPRWFVFMLR
eukprot:549587_1